MTWIVVEAAFLLALCAGGIALMVRRSKRIRSRPGNVPVRLLRQSKDRWLPGHGVWAHDVFVVRAAPSAWDEALFWVVDAKLRESTELERKKLHRIGDRPVVGVFELASGGSVQVAARRGHADALLGPFGPTPSATDSLHESLRLIH
ncbi:MAG TPA: hypothetical protein VFW80_05045 [Gaiellaceae bacterium]|nr:hypothetical protein [Gaiellaceae bacterium]